MLETKKYIPDSMKKLNNWVLWKLEDQTNDRGETRKTKIPIQAVGKKNAMSTEPNTWADFQTAVANKGEFGIGFVLPLDGSMTMIDLDHCVENDKLSNFARSIVERFRDTYMELSQSGTGIHIFVKGNVPTAVKTKEIEIYSSKRYCAMTGNSLRPIEVADYQAELTKLYAEHHKEEPKNTIVCKGKSNLDVGGILELIRHSKNADKFNTYFNGLVEKNSENTLALASILAFYCQNDRDKIEQIMRMSGLVRNKFNSKRAGDTWLGMVIQTAIDSSTAVYDPTRKPAVEYSIQESQIKDLAIGLDAKTYSLRFATFSDIEEEQEETIEYTKSGFHFLDENLGGFALGEVSVWSGVNGSGKSNFLLQECLEFANQKVKTMLFSGEMKNSTIKDMACKMCVGKEKLKQYGNFWVIKDQKSRDYAVAWLDKYLLLYKNDCTTEANEMLYAIRYAASQGCKMIVLDNLMTLDLRSLDRDKYEAQSIFAKMLATLARELDIHIHIVMHPRKVTGFLRKEDISGSADLTNAVDNVFIVHRVNQDFKNRLQEFDKMAVTTFGKFDNIIETCKNRRHGYQGFIGLYFHPETKTFSQEKFQEKRYYYANE